MTLLDPKEAFQHLKEAMLEALWDTELEDIESSGVHDDEPELWPELARDAMTWQLADPESYFHRIALATEFDQLLEVEANIQGADATGDVTPVEFASDILQYFFRQEPLG